MKESHLLQNGGNERYMFSKGFHGASNPGIASPCRREISEVHKSDHGSVVDRARENLAGVAQPMWNVMLCCSFPSFLSSWSPTACRDDSDGSIPTQGMELLSLA